jgi:hypothetical protein
MQRSELVGAALVALVIASLAVRLPLGLDLGDESYYAIFLDDWLKGSIASSTINTLHQTAALLVYPGARLFFLINGSSDGLYIFLRSLFLAASICTCSIWITFLRALGLSWQSWLSGAVVVAFVPFGLPAPSYNTIGQQGLTIGLAAYGCMLLASSNGSRLIWRVISAVAWAVATIAYPSLVVPLGALLVIDVFVMPRAPDGAKYLIFACCAFLAAWTVVINVFSASRLWDGFIYLSRLTDASEPERKFVFSLGLLRANLIFSELCVAAIVIGILRIWLDPRIVGLAIATVLAATLFFAPALFVRSHDAVSLAALSGLGLLHGFARKADSRDRLIAKVYFVSIVAGLITAATAYNGIYNLSIGALPAAALALMTRPHTRSEWLAARALAPLAALTAVLSTSLLVYYGDLPGGQHKRIDKGFFAGIKARPADIGLLDIVQDQVATLSGPLATIGVVGRVPGIALATKARIMMETASPLVPTSSTRAIDAAQTFYRDAAHRPDAVLVYRDPYFEVLNPIGPRFVDWYQLAAERATPLGQLSVFVRREITPPPSP